MQTQDTTNTLERPHWNPSENFPVDYTTSSFETQLGALIAVIEHQQVWALRTVDVTVADRFMTSVAAAPRCHLPEVMKLAHHHENRGANRGRGRKHGRLIDEILVHLPEELPVFVPGTQRYRALRAYRLVRAHLRDTYRDFQQEYTEWRALKMARGETFQEDPEALDFEEQSEVATIEEAAQ